jgi:hypothetical protein
MWRGLEHNTYQLEERMPRGASHRFTEALYAAHRIIPETGFNRSGLPKFSAARERTEGPDGV